MPAQQNASEGRYGPNPHAIYCDRDGRGRPRIAVTEARRGKKGGGKRLKVLSGRDRNIAYPYLSTLLYRHTDRYLAVDSETLRNEYHTISEDVAIQMTLLMDAVRDESEYDQACALAQVVAAMNTCEAAWWRAHYNLRHRPRRVMQAMALMYV